MNTFSRPIIRPLATGWDTIDSSVQSILLLQIPHVEVKDIEMIYYFRNKGFTTLDTMPGIFGVRRLNLTKTIPDYPYLLYGLITASALHSRSHMEPQNKGSRFSLEAKASNFYHLSLSNYRSCLSVISEKTCSSIFAFSVTLASLTFGLMYSEKMNRTEYGLEYINGIMDIFNLLLGAVAIANHTSCMNAVAANPLMLPVRAALFHHSDSAGGETHEILDSLASRIRAAHSLDCSRNREARLLDVSVIYDSAIPELRSMFFGLQRPNSVLSVFSWIAFVGRPFVSLLKQLHPAALVVLAHYGVALLALNHVWWLRGVGSRVILSVVEIMSDRYDEQWLRLLEWPMETLRNPELGASKFSAAHVRQSSYRKEEDRHLKDAKPYELSLAITQTIGIIDPTSTDGLSSHDLGDS